MNLTSPAVQYRVVADADENRENLPAIDLSHEDETIFYLHFRDATEPSATVRPVFLNKPDGVWCHDVAQEAIEITEPCCFRVTNLSGTIGLEVTELSGATSLVVEYKTRKIRSF